MFWVRGVVETVAAMALAYQVIASWVALRHWARRRPSRTPFLPPVSILKPVRGLDRQTYDNFASFCRLDYPTYEILFAVADVADPAIELIERLIADFRERSIRLSVGAPRLGTNDKVNKLLRLVDEATYDVLVVSDADVRVERSYLRKVVQPLEDPDIGLVTALFRGVGDGTWGTTFEALGIATEFVPAVLMAQRVEGLRFGVGATLATTRDRLRRVGGFAPLVDFCADDYELGRRLAASGLQVVLADTVVETEAVGTTWREFVEHQLRWAITVRQARPRGYFGLLLVHALVWVIGAALLSGSVVVAAAWVVSYLVARIALSSIASVFVLDAAFPPGRWLLVPLRDGLAFAIYVMSFFSNRITWRGRKYAVRGGRLIPTETLLETQPAGRA